MKDSAADYAAYSRPSPYQPLQFTAAHQTHFMNSAGTSACSSRLTAQGRTLEGAESRLNGGSDTLSIASGLPGAEGNRCDGRPTDAQTPRARARRRDWCAFHCTGTHATS